MLLVPGDDGEFARVPCWTLQCALAGGVLMDLALERRIDTDPDRLYAVDPTPLGDDLLDLLHGYVTDGPIVRPPLERRRLRSYRVRVKGGAVELAPAG